MFSPYYGGQFVDFEFRGRLGQRCVLAEMLCEFRIVIQPPECVRCENNVRGATPAQLFKIDNRGLAVAGITFVSPVSLKEMPALAMRIIKYRWIASVSGND